MSSLLTVLTGYGGSTIRVTMSGERLLLALRKGYPLPVIPVLVRGASMPTA